MASESKRQNAGTKVPVALPRGEPETTPAMIPREAIYKAVIGARIRITTAAPNSSTTEGTIFSADPISNFLVLLTTPSTTTGTTTSPIQPGTYRFIAISTISSFQLLQLPQSTPDTTSLQLDPSTLDHPSLTSRLNTTLSNLTKAQSRRGPPGTPQEAQDLFDALSRVYNMRWIPSSAAMVFADEYVIEKPYTPENIRTVKSGTGTTQGLDRVRKVVSMEHSKINLRSSHRMIDGNMKMAAGTGVGKENKGAGGGENVTTSPRKGG